MAGLAVGLDRLRVELGVVVVVEDGDARVDLLCGGVAGRAHLCAEFARETVLGLQGRDLSDPDAVAALQPALGL